MEELNIPEFETKDELFKFLKDNKDTLERQKKAQTKHADSVLFIDNINTIEVNKAIGDGENPNELKVKVVINTTNILDSHGDVHQVGIWKKSISENKNILFLQEHRMVFDKIISDGNDLDIGVETISWKELGFNFDGTTQALVFEATIKRDRNEEMFKQYANGWVKEHSVGMRYVQLVLCVNSDKEYYGAEKEAWDKYLPTIVNKEDAEDRGYFYAVKEAKIIEGSAVPKGSNPVTPTLEVKEEPSKDTPKKIEPPVGTQIDYKYLKNNLKLIT